MGGARMKLRQWSLGGLLFSQLLFVSAARADDLPKPAADAGGPATKGSTDAVKKPDDAPARAPGWSPGLAIGGTFNVMDARSVVGVPDGTAVTLGAAIDAELLFNSGIHEWRNGLKVNAGATLTPALGEFVKTSDGLKLESIYLVHVLEMFGPFVRVAYDTQMFPGLDIRAAAVDYSVARLDGSTDLYRGRRLFLTDPFAPSTFKESLGVFVQPLKEDWMNLEARAGIGAQEGLVAGNYAVSDDAATPVVEVKELDDFYQVGGEAVVNVWGFFDEGKRVAYTAGVGVLIPFATSDLAPGDDRSLIELTSFEGKAGLNVKLFDWASLGYQFSAVRQPLLVEDFQIQNSLLLTIGAAWGTKAPAPPPPPPPCDCKKEEPKPVPAAPPEPPPASPAAAPAPAAPSPALAPTQPSQP